MAKIMIQEEKLNTINTNKLVASMNPMVIDDFDPSIFATKYFRESWLTTTHLIDEEFQKQKDYMHNKDKLKDDSAQEIDYLLLFNTRDRSTRLIKIVEFLKLTLDERLLIFKDWQDFYLPRSLWFKSFTALYKIV